MRQQEKKSLNSCSGQSFVNLSCHFFTATKALWGTLESLPVVLGAVHQYRDVRDDYQHANKKRHPPTCAAQSQRHPNKDGEDICSFLTCSQPPHQALRDNRAGGPIRVPGVHPTHMHAGPCIIAFLIYELLILVAL